MNGTQTWRTLAVISAALTLVLALVSSAWAVKRCPPVVAGPNVGVECKVANYGNSSDFGVVITLYNSAGTSLQSCSYFAIGSKESVFCPYHAQFTTDIGCEVTGESGAARVSLTVQIPGSTTTGAAVECR